MPLPMYAAVLAITSRSDKSSPRLLEGLLRSRVMIWLGDVSMALYLFHDIPLLYTSNYVEQPWLRATLCVVSLLASFPAAWLLTEYIEKPAARAIIYCFAPRG